MTIPKKTQNYLTEGIALALIPVAAYLYKFSYDYGYYDYFGIPKELISLSPQSIFAVTVPIMTLILLILYLVLSLLPVRSNQDEEVGNLVINGSFLFVIGFLNLNSPLSKRLSSICFLLLSFIIVRYFVLPVFTLRNTQGYLNKVNSNIKRINPDNYGQKLINFGEYRNSTWAIVIVGFYVFISNIGYMNAMNQKIFWVDTSDTNNVVLNVDEEKAIFIRTNNKSLTGEFWIQNMDRGTKLKLDTKGPLSR